MLDSREGEIVEDEGGRGGDVYMVGNWLLSAARVFTQEPLLSALLMAAVCWAANFVHLSTQPAITTTLNTHTLFIIDLHVFFYSVWLSILTPTSLLPPPCLFLKTHNHQWEEESRGKQSNAKYVILHNVKNIHQYLDYCLSNSSFIHLHLKFSMDYILNGIMGILWTLTKRQVTSASAASILFKICLLWFLQLYGIAKSFFQDSLWSCMF